MASLKYVAISGVLAIVVLTAIVQYFNNSTRTASLPDTSAVLAEKVSVNSGTRIEVKRLVMHNLPLRPDSAWQLLSPVAPYIDALIAMARSGNNEARYVLARNLGYCYYSPKSAPQYEQKREQALRYSDSDVAVTRIDEQYHYCSDIKPSAFEGFIDHLEASADAGFVLAQEHYGTISTDLYIKVNGLSGLERNALIARREAFENKKLLFLDRAMRVGSIKAMARLSWIASNQQGSHGLVEAYAINNTIMRLTDDNTLYNRYAWLNERLEQRLTQADILQALAQSQALIATVDKTRTL